MVDDREVGARYPLAFHYELNGGGEVVDLEREDTGGPVGHPYDPNKIDIVTRPLSVGLILSRLRKGGIDLQPDFQRNAGIWSDTNQSRLIESMLLRIPLPAFYAAENAGDIWAIVDGTQRLTAISRFIDPESVHLPPLVLRDLNYLDFNGSRFADLPGQLQTRLEETELVLHLIRLGTPEEAKFNIFARLNTGGLPLTTQELRHALIPGPARELLAELAASVEFQQATVGSANRSRMADREMVLRFIAFLRSDPGEYDDWDFDHFLREAMHSINGLASHEIDDLRVTFRRVMTASRAIFGNDAFRRLYDRRTGRNPINKALFEAVSVGLAKRTSEQVNELCAASSEVVAALTELMNSDSRFGASISTMAGEPPKVQTRFKRIDDLFARFDGS
ncbi:DUF262 domain-containing protein [Nocardia panacis]|uniref:DUF262 domain-containing protein n=1 Tax=Nocardia panacis TaxID=2340916 RepID=A0A3A4JKJ3_9NOCA|nr:DUF262 domain-containing protein [Nocardia panacis]RJO69085.1 DUF262 domain-containing protein [Nocardia panacis]